MKNWSRRLGSLATPFPLTLAIVHAVLTIAVFRLAILQPGRHGFLPLVIYTLDLPISYVIVLVSFHIPSATYLSYQADTWLLGTSLLLLGTLWWFIIGVVIRKLVIWVVTRLFKLPNHSHSP
jgi:hypothetical protein